MQHENIASASARPDKTTLKMVDHLDSMLAACGDLVRCSPFDFSEEGVGLALRTELTAITHLLQARACAREIMQTDRQLAECAELFLAGTQAMEYATAVSSNEFMLGRRLAMSTATRLSTLMLEAFAAVYLPPDAAAPADEGSFHAKAA